MKHAILVFVLALLACLGFGCGGSHLAPGGSRKAGSATVKILWPERSRLLPQACNSIKIDVAAGQRALGSQTADRPASGNTSSVTFNNLPPGPVTVTATAYPQAGAVGVAQAAGATQVTVADGQNTAFTLTMGSTITALNLAPANPTVAMGSTLQLVATPVDAAGNTVLVAGLAWASADAATATVDPVTGLVTGVAAGSAQITVQESESGKSAATTVAVTPVVAAKAAVTGNNQPAVQVTWARPGVVPADLLGYQIYRSTAAYGNYEPVGQVDGPSESQFFDTTDNRTVQLTQSGSGSQSVQVNGVVPGVTCYYRVRRVFVVEGSVSTSDLSAPTGPATPLALPVLQSPAAGSAVNPAGITFQWLSVAGGDLYKLQVSDTPTFDPARTFSSPDGDARLALPGAAGNQAMSAAFDVSALFAASSQLYWRVGVRQSADAVGPTDGFLFSAAVAVAVPRGRIAFATNRDGNFEIYVMNGDGTGKTRLTTAGNVDSGPAWSPNGARIAFARAADPAGGVGREDIYLMDADGSNLTRLTTDAAGNTAPSWSPDGAEIAFVQWSGALGGSVYAAIRADGSGLRSLTSIAMAGGTGAPAWSPDSTRIAYAFWPTSGNGSGLWVMNRDGSGQTQLLADGTGGISSMNDPAWSPDGTRIAFTGLVGGTAKVFVVNADGTNLKQLSGPADYDQYPRWSPTGTQLTFMSDRGPGYFEIWTMNADGSGQTRLTADPAEDRDPSWGSGGPIPTGGAVGTVRSRRRR